MRRKYLLAFALFLLPSILIVIVAWRNHTGIKSNEDQQDALMSNIVFTAFGKWQGIPMVGVENVDYPTFEQALPVDYFGSITDTNHVTELRRTVFELIKCYSDKSHKPLFTFWDNFQWSLDTNAIPRLLQIGGSQNVAGSPRAIIERAWDKAAENNRIQSVSLVAIKAQFQKTKDVGELVATVYRNEIAKVSQVELPSVITLGASRSVFFVEPMPSKIIASEGLVLYGHVVLFVKYHSPDDPQGGPTVPLVLGFYWSSIHSRWIPHTKGIISLLDPIGIVY